MKKHGCFWTLVGLVIFLSNVAPAQEEFLSIEQQPQINRPSVTSISVGSARLTTLAPSQDIQFGSGDEFRVDLEKPISGSPFSLSSDVSYVTASGRSNYVYQSSNDTYSVPDAQVHLRSYNAALGLKWRLGTFFRMSPYLHMGATAGYFQLLYDQTLSEGGINNQGSEFLGSAGALQGGGFGELGVDVLIQQSWGLRLSNRYMEMATRPVDTLKFQSVRYVSNVYQLGLFLLF